jgi:hypothetical protein
MNIKKYKKIILGLAFIFIFSFPLFSYALTISPPRVEIEADPGTSISGSMRLVNGEEVDRTFYSSFENFEAKGETGVPSFTQSKEDLAGWINTESEINIKANEETIVNYYIDVPKDAEAGGHFAAIFWNTTPPNDAQIAVGAKVGMLILLRVSGDFEEKGGILEFNTKNKQKFYTSLPVNFYYRFQNNGADRAKPKGDIKIKNILGLTREKVNANPVDGNILPSSIRKFEVTWGNNENLFKSEIDDSFFAKFFNNVKREWHGFAFGRYKAKLGIVYGSSDIPASASTVFWVFPWHLLLIIVIGLTGLILLGRRELAKYNKWVVSRAMKNLKSAQNTIKKMGSKHRI